MNIEITANQIKKYREQFENDSKSKISQNAVTNVPLPKLTLNRNVKNKIMSNQVKGNYFRKDFGKIYNILKAEFYFLMNFIPLKVIIRC